MYLSHRRHISFAFDAAQHIASSQDVQTFFAYIRVSAKGDAFACHPSCRTYRNTYRSTSLTFGGLFLALTATYEKKGREEKAFLAVPSQSFEYLVVYGIWIRTLGQQAWLRVYQVSSNRIELVAGELTLDTCASVQINSNVGGRSWEDWRWTCEESE